MSDDNVPGYRLTAVGHVRRSEQGVVLEIEEHFRPALRLLDRFDHALVLWWADRHDNDASRAIMQTELPYAPGTVAGVFACRAEYRPNPVAVTVCRVDKVEEDAGRIWVRDIDAYDGTPLLDIKAYIPVVDRVRHARVAEWMEGWPEWLPDEGIGLDED